MRERCICSYYTQDVSSVLHEQGDGLSQDTEMITKKKNHMSRIDGGVNMKL